ncbi:DUF6677 family protein [Halomarina oriensis]|uniref:Zinc ribbon domain-containing protein n=1 Tax=Halomarina oriensis TaxID=671145 RepID=A0A6B0GQH3_9EURY|nr:DUF6677 family protein [Halomarina oriensis]MWG35617.1 zinc ribbon domain-containing protein [Halomarina oriensis]
MSTRRPWLAAMLAFVYPGLGHVYLREWLRALLWFLLSVSTYFLVFGDTGLDAESLEAAIDAVLMAQEGLPLWTVALLYSVTLFSTVDAYWLATRGADAPTARTAARGADGEASEGATERCPNCRRRVEDDYDFCPWCAAER